MKVKLELDPDQKETEITIHAGKLTPEIERIYQQLQMDSDHPDQIEGMMDNTSYYLSINDIFVNCNNKLDTLCSLIDVV